MSELIVLRSESAYPAQLCRHYEGSDQKRVTPIKEEIEVFPLGFSHVDQETFSSLVDVADTIGWHPKPITAAVGTDALVRELVSGEGIEPGNRQV